MTKKTSKILKRQPMMRKVLIATIPCIAGAVYYFGWRCLAMVLASCAAAFITEYIFCRKRGEPVSEAVFVTAILYALALPPTAPWHVLVTGIVFAIVFAKEVFGGFGRNIFNPAISGRCFVYICFPVAMTSTWAPAATGLFGALGQWTTAAPDAITSATPMALMKSGEYVMGAHELFHGMFLGRLSGTMGVTSALLVLIGGAYLFYTKTANRSMIITVIAVYTGLSHILYMLGIAPVPDGLTAILNGSLLFGAFFMVTDPVSSASTKYGRIIYAALIAICTVVIRNFSVFNGGLMFSIMIGNMFAPIIDYTVKSFQKEKSKPGEKQE